jgi:hypothetical protein
MFRHILGRTIAIRLDLLPTLLKLLFRAFEIRAVIRRKGFATNFFATQLLRAFPINGLFIGQTKPRKKREYQ